MKPEISNGTIGAINISNGSLSTVSSHLQVARGYNSNKGISTGDEAANMNFWIQGFSTKAEQDNVKDVSGYNSKGNGIVIGVDKEVNLDTIYGIALSFGSSDVTSKDTLRDAKADIIAKQLMVYFSQNYGRSYLEGYFSKGWNDNSSSRDIILGTNKRTASANYNSKISTIKLAYGNNIKVSNVTFTPNVSLASSMVSTNTYTENGAQGANLTVDTKDMSKVTSTIGVIVDLNSNQDALFTPKFRVSYKKNFGDDYSKATAQFRDAKYTFSTKGIEVDDNAMVYGTTLQYKSRSGMSVYKVDFEVTKSEHYQSSIGSFTARFKF